jgi:hypothetical protein
MMMSIWEQSVSECGVCVRGVRIFLLICHLDAVSTSSTSDSFGHCIYNQFFPLIFVFLKKGKHFPVGSPEQKVLQLTHCHFINRIVRGGKRPVTGCAVRSHQIIDTPRATRFFKRGNHFHIAPRILPFLRIS